MKTIVITTLTCLLLGTFNTINKSNNKAINNNLEIGSTCLIDTFNFSTVTSICFENNKIDEITINPYTEPKQFDEIFGTPIGVKLIFLNGSISKLYLVKNQHETYEYVFNKKGKVEKLSKW